MNMREHNSTRLDYLDAARSFALILGIIFHASLSFMPIFIGWAVMDISTSERVPLFMLVSHSFRMALFLLVAGFFSHMTFQKLGLSGFLKSRLLRVGVPLVIGWFLLRPLLVSGWIMGAESMRGEVHIGNALLEGLKRLGQLPNEFLIGTHLWFLYYLLLVCVTALLLHYLIRVHTPTKAKVT
ncbi:MAG: acyltransferase family protein, partial [Gilvibacter sp.]